MYLHGITNGIIIYTGHYTLVIKRHGITKTDIVWLNLPEDGCLALNYPNFA